MSLNKFLAVPLSLTIAVAFSNASFGATTGDNSNYTPPKSSQLNQTDQGIKDDTKKSEKRKLASQAYQKALQLKKDGNIGASLLELMKAVNNNPLLMDAYYQQALIFKEQGLNKLASSRLEQALAIDPNFNEARVLLATIAIEQGNLHKAFNQLGKSLNKKEPKSIEPEAEKIAAIPKVPAPPLDDELKKKETKKTKKFFSRKKKSRKRKKKNKRISRTKIRKIIAKRYKKFHKSYRKPRHNQPWYTKYTRMIGWANPFRFGNDGDRSKELFTESYSDLASKQEGEKVQKEKELVAKANKFESNVTAKEDKALDKLFGKSQVNDLDLVAPILELENLADADDSPPPTTTPQVANKPEPVAKESERTANLLSTKFQQQRILKANISPQKATLTFLPEASSIAEVESPKEKEFKPPVDDEWTKRLVDLNKNGTGTLKRGEAFMFSEDTGEAVIFLADGRRIRRIIAPTQSAERVVKLRRPDVLVPKELFYDVSLLGKVIGQKPKPKKLPIRTESKDRKGEPPTFHMEKLMDESRTFVGTIRDVLRL